MIPQLTYSLFNLFSISIELPINLSPDLLVSLASRIVLFADILQKAFTYLATRVESIEESIIPLMPEILLIKVISEC